VKDKAGNMMNKIISGLEPGLMGFASAARDVMVTTWQSSLSSFVAIV
jgi:hypothetical protein